MDGHQANGAFVACGPPGFTALALINLGDNARNMCVSEYINLGPSLKECLLQPQGPKPRIRIGWRNLVRG